MEEPLAICVGGLLGVTAAHPPPGTGQPQSQGTSSTPPAPLPHLLLHSMPLQLGEGKEKRGSSGYQALVAVPGRKPCWSALRWDRNVHREPTAACAGCCGPGAEPQCQRSWTSVPERL